MSEFEIADETIRAMWDRIALVADEFATTSDGAHLLLEVASRHFLYMLCNFPEHVLTCVTAPASGAGKHRLVIAINGTFERDFTSAAKSAYEIGAH